MKFNVKKYPIEAAAEDLLRACAEFIRRKKDMSEAIMISSICGVFVAVIVYNILT